MFYEIGAVKEFAKFTVKLLYRSLCFNGFVKTVLTNFIKKEGPVQVFSYEFCEILKNIFFT